MGMGWFVVAGFLYALVRSVIALGHNALFYWVDYRLSRLELFHERGETLDPIELQELNIIALQIGMSRMMLLPSGRNSAQKIPPPNAPWDPAHLISIVEAYIRAKRLDPDFPNTWWKNFPEHLR